MQARSRSQSRRVLAVLGAALALTSLGCSGSSAGDDGGSDAISDATTSPPEDSNVAPPPEGDAMTGAGPLDATTADEGAPEGPIDGSLDALSDAGAGATGMDAGDAESNGTDAGMGTDAGADAGASLDAGPDADAPRADASPPAPDAGTPTFTSIYANIITPSCGECHAQPPPLESNLYMGTQQDAYDNLVNVRAMGDACGSPAIDGAAPPLRVLPGDAADSLLYQKITNTQRCGSAMPLDSDPLTSDQVLTIATWINQGAQDN